MLVYAVKGNKKKREKQGKRARDKPPVLAHRGEEDRFEQTGGIECLEKVYLSSTYRLKDSQGGRAAQRPKDTAPRGDEGSLTHSFPNAARKRGRVVGVGTQENKKKAKVCLQGKKCLCLVTLKEQKSSGRRRRGERCKGSNEASKGCCGTTGGVPTLTQRVDRLKQGKGFLQADVLTS